MLPRDFATAHPHAKWLQNASLCVVLLPCTALDVETATQGQSRCHSLELLKRMLSQFCHAGGKIGIIDYGQSKQLPPRDRLALANLIIALVDKDLLRVSQTMDKLGIKTSSSDPAVRAKIAYGMFDTSMK